MKDVLMDFLALYRAEPIERIRIVKLGLPATTVGTMAKSMGVQKSWLATQLGIKPATVTRRARDNKPLGTADSERLLGMARLVGQVQQMVNESGNPDGFDAAQWTARWLQRPLPAFGGELPVWFMDTVEGQSLVSYTVSCMQTGVYC